MSSIDDFAISDSRKRMGRPPLGIVTTTVRLSKETLAKIDAIAGPNRRAEFIRKAVEEALKRAKG